MNNKYITRTTRISIMPQGDPIFGETCTHISIEDEASGEYVKVQQHNSHIEADTQAISIDPEEWTILKDGIEKMLEEIKQNEQQS